MKLLLHIGAHRTGSTSLQSLLRDCQAELKSRNYSYPTSVTDRHPDQHSELALLVKAGKLTEAGRYVVACRREVSTDATLILSGEEFSHLSQAEVETLRSILQLFTWDEISIVLYTRNFIDYISSNYRHHLNDASYVVNPWSFAKHYRNIELDMTTVLRYWQSVFGLARCHAFTYEDVAQETGKHFLKFLGVADIYPSGPRSRENNHNFFTGLARNYFGKTYGIDFKTDPPNTIEFATMLDVMECLARISDSASTRLLANQAIADLQKAAR